MSQEMYFLYLDGVQRGPYTVRQIGHMVNTGIVHSDALFWCEGLDQWQPVKQLIMPKSEIHRRRVRLSASSLVFVVLLAVAGWTVFPSLSQGWKEQHQVEVTPKAAYWRARGVLREHLGRFSSVTFADFSPSAVMFTGAESASVELSVLPPKAGEGQIPVRWRVEVLYDGHLKMWGPAMAVPARL